MILEGSEEADLQDVELLACSELSRICRPPLLLVLLKVLKRVIFAQVKTLRSFLLGISILASFEAIFAAFGLRRRATYSEVP
jgi:hypothetical protein